MGRTTGNSHYDLYYEENDFYVKGAFGTGLGWYIDFMDVTLLGGTDEDGWLGPYETREEADFTARKVLEQKGVLNVGLSE